MQCFVNTNCTRATNLISVVHCKIYYIIGLLRPSKTFCNKLIFNKKKSFTAQIHKRSFELQTAGHFHRMTYLSANVHLNKTRAYSDTNVLFSERQFNTLLVLFHSNLVAKQ